MHSFFDCFLSLSEELCKDRRAIPAYFLDKKKLRIVDHNRSFV